MKLTNEEIRHLENINKQQRDIFKLRYVFLLMGVILIGLAFIPAIYFWVQGNIALFDIFTAHPVFYLLPISGGIAIGYAIQGLKGNSVYTLLSKVVEELREK